MKKIISLLGVLILALAIMPLAFAEEASVDDGWQVDVGQGANCADAVIYKDHTARIWEPNDQTVYTATEYGQQVTNVHGYTGWEVPLRQNYVFQGETLKYFVIVEDTDGTDSIDYVRMRDLTNGVDVGSCLKVTAFTDLSAFIGDNGKTIASYNPATMESYVCTWIIPSDAVYGSVEINLGFRVNDLTSQANCAAPILIDSLQSDLLFVNPALAAALTLNNGPIVFNNGAAVSEGTVAMSNTVTVQNTAPANSGVIMDMYIAADDYFVDPANVDAICGAGNGIKYDRFSYYATKGSINSGANDNSYPALGEKAAGLCVADATEFTPLPSHSGHIEDMCRIINHAEYGSLLAQGSSMSLTFKVDIPTPCTGSFNDGQFHIVGRVV